eukprot:1185365-Rhodomonas_salina.1
MQQHALHQVDLAHRAVLHQRLLYPRAQVRFRVSVGVGTARTAARSGNCRLPDCDAGCPELERLASQSFLSICF